MSFSFKLASQAMNHMCGKPFRNCNCEWCEDAKKTCTQEEWEARCVKQEKTYEELYKAIEAPRNKKFEGER